MERLDDLRATQPCTSGGPTARWLVVLGTTAMISMIAGGCTKPIDDQMPLSLGGGAADGVSDEDSSGGGDEEDGTSGSSDSMTGGQDSAADDTGASGGEETGDEEGSTGEPPEQDPYLEPAIWAPGTAGFDFDHGGSSSIPIVGAPADADLIRSATLHDGTDAMLYVMNASSDGVYELAFDDATGAFEHDGAPSIPLVDFPDFADRSSFAMLHDGTYYRLYFLSVDPPLRLVQGALDPEQGAFVFGFSSIEEIDVVGTPAGADWSGWGMQHDGVGFRLYAFASASHDSVFQHTFAGGVYQHGVEFSEPIELLTIPEGVAADDFTMLHDGGSARLYLRGAG